MENIRIVFLHHSTGQNIWNGDRSTILSKFIGKVSTRLSYIFCKPPALPSSFKRYNKKHKQNYTITDLVFPKRSPYGWKNYPFDYYNIWVKNAGENTFMEEPTLEILTRNYNVIIFKHCFPVCNIQDQEGSGDINSEIKSLTNYKIQYLALREKLNNFSDTKFIVFTGAARIKSQISESEALRAREFFDWIIKEWNQPDDNIYIWDLYNLQTEGGIYFKDTNAYSINNSHPNDTFSGYASELLFKRIIDVIETSGSRTTLKGEGK